MIPDVWSSWLDDSLHSWSERQLLRVLHPTLGTGNPTEVLVSRDVVQHWGQDRSQSNARASAGPGSELVPLRLFSLNDYMGLSQHPRVCKAAAEAAERFGMGPRSSAIVAGYSQQHRDLELALAGLKGAEDCLLFPTGFAANMAAVAALCAEGDTAIFSDELNHASIIDGARLATRGEWATLECPLLRALPDFRAPPVAGSVELHVYRHNDLEHLEELLSACRRPRKLVVTDSLFSMDGDFADLRGLAALKRRHGFLWAVDEAHASLVRGQMVASIASAFGPLPGSSCSASHRRAGSGAEGRQR